jgi:hypothetical protein
MPLPASLGLYLWRTLYGYPGGLVAKAGKIIGLISPLLALGIIALMLFGPGYSYQSASCEASPGHESSQECTYESGTISAFRYAIEEGDTTLFYWAGFIIAICLVAAVGALAGTAAPVWVCAVVLFILAVLGMMSIGLFIFPLAGVLFVSATFLTVARYESRGA